MNRLKIKIDCYKKCAHCLEDGERFSMYYYLSLPFECNYKSVGESGAVCSVCYSSILEVR